MPSLRRRSFIAKSRSILRGSMRGGIAVSWWMTTSGRDSRTAAVTAGASRASASTGSAPSARSSSTLAGDLVMPVTWWPSASSSGRSLRPITPLAPARKTLMRGGDRARSPASRRVRRARRIRGVSTRAQTCPSLKPAAPMPKVALKRERRFSSAIRLTSSTSCGSSKRARSAANSSSLTCTGVAVIPTARSSTRRSVSSNARCRGSGADRAAARRRRLPFAHRASRCPCSNHSPPSLPT